MLRRGWIVFWAVLSSSVALAQKTPPAQHVETLSTARLRITYDYSAWWPPGGGQLAIFKLPIPANVGTQEILSFNSSLHGQVETDSQGRRVLSVTIRHHAGNDRHLRWQVVVTGDFRIRHLVDGPPAAGSIPPRAPAPGQFLASTESIDWKSDGFQSWIDDAGLRRRPGEPAIDCARRTYAYCRDHGEYDYPPSGGWKASGACRRLRTDCGGFSLVFTAACRANGIPARLLVGQWFKTEGAGDALEQTGRQAHVIAEFFDPALGWIPEDLSSTLMKIPGAPDCDYFGREPGYFFAWHTDTDFHFSVPEKSDEHVQWMQNPAPWFSADAEDAADSSSHHWTVEPVPASAAAEGR